MKQIVSIVVLIALVGCATPAEKWTSIPRGPDLTIYQFQKSLGKPSSVRYERTKVFRYGPGGWFDGVATIYRYDFGENKGMDRYVEFYFDGDKYLADSTNLPLKFQHFIVTDKLNTKRKMRTAKIPEAPVPQRIAL